MIGSKVPHRWEKKSTEIHADCRIFEVQKSRFHHPARDTEGDFFVIDARDWITVVAVTPQGELVTVRQFRFGIEDLSLEVPAGVMEHSEDPVESAIRELREETGFAGSEAELLGWVYPNPAIQNNRCFVIGIRDAEHAVDPDWDEHEELQTQLIPLDRVPGLLSEGQFRHALSLCALQYYFLKNPV